MPQDSRRGLNLPRPLGRFLLREIQGLACLPGLAASAVARAGLESFAEVVRPAAVDTPLWQKAPFKLPPRRLDPQDVAARILQAYQVGTQGCLDLSSFRQKFIRKHCTRGGF